MFFKEEHRRRFYAAYTILAVLFFAGIYLLFFRVDRSLVWNSDGMKQHYISLAYYGNYLRSILKNIFIDHTFEIPMWDLHIGYGSDIVSTLNYYVLGDPLTLLSVLVPERYTEYLYGFLIFLRMYLAGFAFSRFCFYHKHKQIPVLLGSMIYISSLWILATGFDHPFFVNPCIYLPLLLLGVDKILTERKPLTYILSVGIAGMVNFYFFYMLGIFTVIYAVFRYFMVYKGWNWERIGKLLGSFFLYSVVGFMISAVILLPVIMTALGTDRMEASYYVAALYRPYFYKQLPVSLIGSRLARYTIVGVAGICAMSLAVLFMKRKKYFVLKVGAVFLMLLYCLPVVGHVMNGFSYVTNRWSWAGVMFFTYLFVKMYPEFFELKKKERLILFAISLVYGIYVIWQPSTRSVGNVVSGLVLIVTAICFLAVRDRGKTGRNVINIIIICSIGGSIFANMSNGFGFTGTSLTRLSKYLKTGAAYERSHSEIYSAMKTMPDISAYRFEQNLPSTLYNASMLNGLNGGQYYFSVAPAGVNDFFEKTGVSHPLEQIYPGINSRTWLMKLFSMRYFVGKEGKVPYGFYPVEQGGELSGGVCIYEDKNPLPLAYTYDKYISSEEFEGMTTYERQEAMLQGVVLESSSLPECQPEFTSAKIPFTVVESDGVSLGKHGFGVKKKNGSCVLELKGKAACETYLSLEKFRYQGRVRGESKVFEQRATTAGEVFINVLDDDGANSQKIKLRSPRSNYQTSRDSYLFNLGYHDEPVTRVKLTFTSKGKYTFDSFEAVCQEMDTLDSLSSERAADQVEDLAVDGNHVTCSINLTEPKALVFSIPYHKGWSLTVDGETAELKKANGLFMAAELEPGSHTVHLRYTTPYIRLGALLTVAGVLLTVLVWGRRRQYDIVKK
ncbi:YfhO family protein [Blautia schinkii]|nr:YfhO family protein [Blautia schinkii]